MALSWHARLMVLAWGVISPLAVVIARFYKITPDQDWPRELDNRFWWKSHYLGQSVNLGLSAFGLSLILMSPQDISGAGLHRVLGYVVLALGVFQLASGLLRGRKGGPTDPKAQDDWSGDHYDMSARRLAFEAWHKILGYSALLLAAITILTGMWSANAPVWMWIGVLGWWVTLAVAAAYLQGQGRAYDTYQAIWGPDLEHPGNRMKKQGYGTVRPSETGIQQPKEGDHVWSD